MSKSIMHNNFKKKEKMKRGSSNLSALRSSHPGNDMQTVPRNNKNFPACSLKLRLDYLWRLGQTINPLINRIKKGIFIKAVRKRKTLLNLSYNDQNN